MKYASWIIGGVCLLFLCFYAFADYVKPRDLTIKEQALKNYRSNVSTVYQRHTDILDSLVKKLKNEKELSPDIKRHIVLCEKGLGEKGPTFKEKVVSDLYALSAHRTKMSSDFATLLAMLERMPQLTSLSREYHEQRRALLEATTQAERLYEKEAMEYNLMLKKFPYKFFALIGNSHLAQMIPSRESIRPPKEERI